METPPGPQAPSSSTSKRFHCTRCSKSYTKLEHLQRHERTHSNSRPFRCHECGKGFGRQDVLGRHVRLHSNTQLRNRPSAPLSRNFSPNLNVEALQEYTESRTARHSAGTTAFSTGDVATHNTFHDSDDLLNWLLPELSDSPVVPLPLADWSGLETPSETLLEYPTVDDRLHPRPEIGSIQQVFKLIHDTSKRLSSDYDGKGITVDFLDACLHEYFERIAPSFPVIHEPTFSSQKAIPPLLLNMVALGSLFVCMPNAMAKGELLWRLGHTAVATSWQTLIGLRGPHDRCEGVQLVLTALLGQTYALASSNPDIRSTAFIFHGLGFYWARTRGMFSLDERPLSMPEDDAPPQEKQVAWERWAASEVQRRAVLGHYILDGFISQASGCPASVRHLVNRIGAACSDEAFAARSADNWVVAMSRADMAQLSMAAIYTRIFQSESPNGLAKISPFCVSVILEGLLSLISDTEVDESSFGLISRLEIVQALLNVYQTYTLPAMSSGTANAYNIMIRWHTVCIEIAAPLTPLYNALRGTFEIPNQLAGVPATSSARPLHLAEWARGTDAIRALLHATAIIRLLRTIPLHQTNAVHIPTAIFQAALVLCSLPLHGTNVLEIPEAPPWRDVWDESRVEKPMTAFELLYKLQCAESMTCVNLSCEINFLQLCLRTAASRWGISESMEVIVAHLAGLTRRGQGSIA